MTAAELRKRIEELKTYVDDPERFHSEEDDMAKETWKEMLDDALEGRELISCTLSDEELNVEFDSGWGGAEGKPFTAWCEQYVYFPVVYDGAEWVGKAPRNPCDEATNHVGGG